MMKTAFCLLSVLCMATALLTGDVLAAGNESADAVPTGQTVCPVMGGPVNEDIHVEYEGRTIYFCCPACVSVFQEDPEKYLRKMDAETGKGRE